MAVVAEQQRWSSMLEPSRKVIDFFFLKRVQVDCQVHQGKNGTYLADVTCSAWRMGLTWRRY